MDATFRISRTMPRHFGQRDNATAARRLREEMTDAERLVWNVLRAGRFHGLKFRRQHPLGPFVLDFFCSRLQLAIEIDGAVHDPGPARGRDAERQRAIEALGIRVLRLRNAEVMTDALGTLEAALRPYLNSVDPAPNPTDHPSLFNRGDG